jgi:hypothetical protein
MSGTMTTMSRGWSARHRSASSMREKLIMQDLDLALRRCGQPGIRSMHHRSGRRADARPAAAGRGWPPAPAAAACRPARRRTGSIRLMTGKRSLRGFAASSKASSSRTKSRPCRPQRPAADGCAHACLPAACPPDRLAAQLLTARSPAHSSRPSMISAQW